MFDPLSDIVTRRLALRLMRRQGIVAALAGDVAKVANVLGARVPDDLSAYRSSFMFAQAEMNADPEYEPWSDRAIILSAENVMVGRIRFHSCPKRENPLSLTQDAVELGYGVFPGFRRRGYGAEAVGAVMDWAHSAFGVRKFLASVSPNNTASLALIARFGFLRVGHQIDEIDGPEDVYLREIST